MKTLQLRCPACRKKLFKWEKGSKQITDKAQDLEYKKVRKHMIFRCPKCGIYSNLKKNHKGEAELFEVEISERIQV